METRFSFDFDKGEVTLHVQVSQWKYSFLTLISYDLALHKNSKHSVQCSFGNIAASELKHFCNLP